MLSFSFITGATKPQTPTFFDKWVVNFKEKMDPDVAIIETLKVQLLEADIKAEKGEKMLDGSTTLVSDTVFCHLVKCMCFWINSAYFHYFS